MEANNDGNDNRAAAENIPAADNNDGEEDGNENGGGGDNPNPNNNNVIDIDLEDEVVNMDGGVAINPEEDDGKATKLSTDSELLLYIYCEEPIDVAPDHPIMRPGVSVSIGFDKTTKLRAVFQRYVDFCNIISEEGSTESPAINLRDLEFAFCQLLNENDTAETSALMKNDRIKVRKIRTDERAKEAERKRTLRDADREFFRQMRHLLPESCPARIADVMLDCRGKLLDNNGRNQCVLRTTVRAHSALISKRCPWLMTMILQAREKARRERLEQHNAEQPETPDHSPTCAAEIENDDEAENGEASDNVGKEIGRGDDDISASAQIDIVDVSSENGKVNVIVVDDDEDEDNNVVSSSLHQVQPRPEADVLTVVINDHSPEAIKILLEYCYTNRVVSLGHDAFVQACKTKPSKHNGPVHPYHSKAKQWPNNGTPILPFSVALAAIRLAEEAGMHRLSLMCEVSAAQLVSSGNVVEALSMTTRQKTVSGNDLPRLRRAAMDVILRRGRRGVSEIGRSSCFKKALEEERSVIVPTLFQGTMEVVSHWEKVRGKRRITELHDIDYRDLDREDSYKRMKERKFRRRERQGKEVNKTSEQYEGLSDSSLDDIDVALPYGFRDGQFIAWCEVPDVSPRALARLAHHNMDSIRRDAVSKVLKDSIKRESRELKLNKVNNNRKRSSRNSSKSRGFFGVREK
eukprot:jgi/Psemu1/327517/estExt_fgenesh1_pg.C_6940001